MNLNEASKDIFLYDLFDSIEVNAYHCSFRFYSPNRDDAEWIDVDVRLRLNNFSLRLELYDETIIARVFKNVFGNYSTENDPIERGGDTGVYYIASFTDGKPFPTAEYRIPVKAKELDSIKYQVIRKLRIEGLKVLWSCDTAAALS